MGKTYIKFVVLFSQKFTRKGNFKNSFINAFTYNGNTRISILGSMRFS